jgi:hypothetical protein
MTTLKRVLLIAIVTLVTLVGSGGRLGALPGSESDTVYYDQDMNMIGEHAITCSGAHYIWGQQSGVFRGIETDSCNTDAYSRQCAYFSGTWGWTDYSCDDPPPCGYGVTCP